MKLHKHFKHPPSLKNFYVDIFWQLRFFSHAFQLSSISRYRSTFRKSWINGRRLMMKSGQKWSFSREIVVWLRLMLERQYSRLMAATMASMGWGECRVLKNLHCKNILMWLICVHCDVIVERLKSLTFFLLTKFL